jgi:hypothetical protein
MTAIIAHEEPDGAIRYTNRHTGANALLVAGHRTTRWYALPAGAWDAARHAYATREAAIAAIEELIR